MKTEEIVVVVVDEEEMVHVVLNECLERRNWRARRRFTGFWYSWANGRGLLVGRFGVASSVRVGVSCRPRFFLSFRFVFFLIYGKTRLVRQSLFRSIFTFFVVTQLAARGKKEIRKKLIHDFLDVLFVFFGEGHLTFDEENDQRRSVVQDRQIFVTKG